MLRDYVSLKTANKKSCVFSKSLKVGFVSFQSWQWIPWWKKEQLSTGSGKPGCNFNVKQSHCLRNVCAKIEF